MFMRQDVAERIGRLFKAGIVPTATQLEEMRASRAAARSEAKASSNEPDNYSVVGNIAQVRVCGVLAEEPDFWAWLLGIDQTTYADIRDAFALAAANPQVTKVMLSVDSPGGFVDGLFETLATIESFGKPITVEAGQACSAAYAMAAMAGPIFPRGPASVFGSIGVAASYYVDPNQIDIASTEAPNKRPNVATEEGKAIVRAELDALHELFVEAIVRGRKNATGKSYTVAQVNADFGRGGTVLTDVAHTQGMIDKKAKAPKRGSVALDDVAELPAVPEKIASASDGGAEPQSPAVAVELQKPSSLPNTGSGRTKNMDEAAFKAQHPELYASIVAAAEARGTASERRRVLAHRKLANSTGAYKVADAAIESGASTMDEDVHAEYMTAAMNRNAIAARETEGAAAAAVTEGAVVATPAAKDLGDEVADRLDAMYGRKPKA
jgi:ClpP class serine protease